MRRARLRGEGHHFVHTISRVIDRQYRFGQEEKDYFCKLVRDQSKFSGVNVVTACVLCNHFHLLLEQLDASCGGRLSWPELEKRLAAIYQPKQVQSFRNEYENLVKMNDPELLDQFFSRFERRMNDVSMFMKEVKQKFTQWYNRRNNRKGTLWEERFKSVLVEGSQATLMVMAAYIDLNPIRAGIVERVEDYPWCGYAQAVRGDPDAREGLGIILDQSHHIAGDDFAQQWEETHHLYRQWLYHRGREVAGDADRGIRGKKGFSDDEVEQVVNHQTKCSEVSIAESLRNRVGYLSTSRAFGTEEFIDQEFTRSRSTPGPSVRSRVKQFDGAQWQSFWVL